MGWGRSGCLLVKGLVSGLCGKKGSWDLGNDIQPTPRQTKPGIQQPPPILLPQGVLPSAHSVIPPPHVAPAGQQPTGPSPVSATSTHFSPSPQQLLGNPIEEQLVVPPGHAHWRFSRKARANAARRKRLPAGGVLSSWGSGSESRANGGRGSSSAEALAHILRASSSSRAPRAAIAACG